MRLLTTPAERFERSIGRNLKRSEQTATPAKTSAASVSAAFALTDRVPADPNCQTQSVECIHTKKEPRPPKFALDFKIPIQAITDSLPGFSTVEQIFIPRHHPRQYWQIHFGLLPQPRDEITPMLGERTSAHRPSTCAPELRVSSPPPRGHVWGRPTSNNTLAGRPIGSVSQSTRDRHQYPAFC